MVAQVDVVGSGAFSATALLTAGAVSSIGAAGIILFMIADSISTALVIGSTLADMAVTVAGVK